jgi:HEPN domain-containing protein
MQWGSDTYRRGALERLEDARVLNECKRYALSMYAAGVAVEGMLRALHGLRDKVFDERHDLRRIAVKIENLGLLRPGEPDQDFVSSVQGVARHWSNDLRFADQDQLERFLRGVDEIRRHTEGELRRVCNEQFDRCSVVLRRCETLLTRHASR